jgi:hypothetical protein
MDIRKIIVVTADSRIGGHFREARHYVPQPVAYSQRRCV